MVGFKSLGLAGARNTLRRLFRRSPPAADSEDTSTSSSKHDSSTAQESHNPVSASNNPTAIAAVSPTPPEQPREATSTPLEPSPVIADTGHGETRADDMAVDIKVALPAHLPRALPKSNENRFSHLELEDATEALGRLNMNGTPSSNSATAVVGEVAEGAKPLETMMPDLDDPAVQAERRKHLDFIGEALDMVSLLSFARSFWALLSIAAYPTTRMAYQALPAIALEHQLLHCFLPRNTYRLLSRWTRLLIVYLFLGSTGAQDKRNSGWMCARAQ
jgi:hypothetical protein